MRIENSSLFYDDLPKKESRFLRVSTKIKPSQVLGKSIKNSLCFNEDLPKSTENSSYFYEDLVRSSSRKENKKFFKKN